MARLRRSTDLYRVPVGSAVLLCLIGVFAFEEKLSSTELAGFTAAALAIALLGQAE